MIWILTLIVLFTAQKAGSRATARLRTRFLTRFALCLLQLHFVLGPPCRAWTASSRTGVFTGRKWQFVLAHQLLSEKRHFLISNSVADIPCLSSQNRVKCPPRLGGRGEEGREHEDARISLDTLQVLSPGERPLAG